MYIPPLVVEMIGTMQESLDGIKDRITDVKEGPIVDGIETITFYLDNTKIRGFMRGRNRDLIVGYSEASDKSLALRCWLDHDVEEVKEDQRIWTRMK